MTLIRIGNDINVSWSIFSRNGDAYIINGSKVRLQVVSGPFKKIITDFVTIGNKINFTFRSVDIHRLGIYKMILSITGDSSETEEATFDFQEIFQIVSATYTNTQNNILDGDVLVEPSSMIENVVENIVSNAPDGEDLTVVGNFLKLRDRSAGNGSKGYVILRTNRTFAEQVTLPNTIYEIRYSFDLGGASVTIPAGCVLKFNGGRIYNGSLQFDNTAVDCNEIRAIFPQDCSGIITNKTLYPEWFYADDWKEAINVAVVCARPCAAVELTASEYYLGNTFDGSVIMLKDNVSLISGRKSRLFTRAADAGDAYYSMVEAGNNSVVRGVFFDQSEERLTGNEQDTQLKHFCIGGGSKKDVLIQDCVFKYFTNAIMCNSGQGLGKAVVDNCEFLFFRMADMGREDYDTSAIYLRSGENRVTNCRISAKSDIVYPPHGGIELHGFNSYCRDNVLYNCRTGIYCTNDVRTTAEYYDDKYNTNTSFVIEGNTFKKVDDCIVLWSRNDFDDGTHLQDIKDVIISGNIGTDVGRAINFHAAEGQTYGYKNVCFVGNSFEGRTIAFTPADYDEENYIFRRNTAIFCTPSSDVEKFEVVGNVFTNFCGIIATGTSYTTSSISIMFRGNVCKNILNYTLSADPGTAFPLSSAVFYANQSTDIQIIDNVFTIAAGNLNRPLLISSTISKSLVRWTWRRNKLVGFSGAVTLGNAIMTNVENLDTDEASVQTIKTQTDLTYNENDVKIDTSSPALFNVSACYSRGTNKSSTFTSGKCVRRGYYGYFIADNYAQIDVGDYVVLNSDSHSNVTLNVVAKVGSVIFHNSSLNTAWRGTFGEEESISSLTFRTPGFRKVARLDVGEFSGKPSGSSVQIGYKYYAEDLRKTITAANVSGGTVTWVEADGEVAGIRRSGTFAQAPTPTNVGFRYFCTSGASIDGGATEKTNIEIFYTGSGWVDAGGVSVVALT